MSTCNTAFAFGLTGNEFIILCIALGAFIGMFCALVRYLNGPYPIDFIDVDLYTKDELRRMRLQRK
ncbi:hypothetical protein pEaSNUABM56_00034 [Erwinia phage pEa_SNUABM_56]|uniref:Uncharacterized protein n=1 Tax=Erwinia phage pEp_SNUABM_01 TaxID=2601643 RepID=A0A5J6DAE1_9CAUD|nr:hypothetical protein HWC63_gp008 [Erwinia phage pEp_SNUABM_01]QEQ94834.1 hypothetical protein pEpSNUABM01_008 [Erwinia phage pEp_SNUABM_01]UYL85079.1 hypothetical protein pEaSNUABM56_00034 [Erwinia phage pEa_SNUABM_56]